MSCELFDYSVPPRLGVVQNLPDFLAITANLTLKEQIATVQQALQLFEQLYVHLPMKKAIHATDPPQRLRLLARQLSLLKSPMRERAFHNEMISIFISARDLHTNYILPAPYNQSIAFLPFHVEEFYKDQDAEECQYVVTAVIEGLNHPEFQEGVVLTSWNGQPISRTVEINAELNAGSNPDARHARGLESLTLRPMMMSMPPDEYWALIGFTMDNGKSAEIRLPWKTFTPTAQNGVAVAAGKSNAAARKMGLDLVAETLRRTKIALFKPDVAAKRAAFRASLTGGAPRAGAAQTDPFAGVLTTREVKTKSGTFGYLRIFAFAPDNDSDFENFVDQFIDRIQAELRKLPQDGLIIDVRGNGGGYIPAGERLLQFFTPKRITPERFEFITTALTQRLANKFSDLKPWSESMNRSVETAAAFSQGFALTTEEEANNLGQQYQGPVVLITDARCYSTTDIFTAGFQDHEIGPILGASGNTGAGGANVWDYRDLQEAMKDVFTGLPKETGMRVAVRRCTRTGERAGMILEELGVVPDQPVYKMTHDDLFKENVDLIETAAALLKKQKAYVLNGSVTAGNKKITLETKGLDRVDIFVKGRPAASVDVQDGKKSVAEVGISGSVRLDGYADGKLVVTKTL